MNRGLEHFDRVGEEVVSTIERRSASLVHVRVRRVKFLPKDRNRLEPPEFNIAAPFGLPIERGLAGPGLVANTVVRRFADHLPLHRQQKIYARGRYFFKTLFSEPERAREALVLIEELFKIERKLAADVFRQITLGNFDAQLDQA